MGRKLRGLVLERCQRQHRERHFKPRKGLVCVTAYIWPSVEHNYVLSDVFCFSNYVCTESLQSSHSLLQLAKYSIFFFLIESVFSAKWKKVLAQSFHP